MEKIDVRKSLHHLYSPRPGQPELVTVPPLNYAMIDGKGDPNTSGDFQGMIETLYGVSFAVKFSLKRADPPVDYTVMGLEGLFWTDTPDDFSMERKDDWQWTLMILQPEFVTPEVFQNAKEQLAVKKPALPWDRLRLETLEEGLSAQIMHLGPYAEEPPTITALHAFIKENGYRPRGKHHEIYLSDPRRSQPEKLRTIIRQPVR